MCSQSLTAVLLVTSVPRPVAAIDRTNCFLPTALARQPQARALILSRTHSSPSSMMLRTTQMETASTPLTSTQRSRSDVKTSISPDSVVASAAQRVSTSVCRRAVGGRRRLRKRQGNAGHRFQLRHGSSPCNSRSKRRPPTSRLDDWRKRSQTFSGRVNSTCIACDGW
jgi:hypothetical protein